MDLVSAAVGLQQAKTSSQIQMAIARKALDSQRLEGAGVLKLLEAASTGTVAAGDKLVAAAIGLGGQIDTYA